jgi:protein arginine N-methyltransferase 3
MSVMSSNSSSAGESDWQDLEPDEEVTIFKSLLDDKTFGSAEEMLSHTKKEHNLDFLAVVKRLQLDFYGAIKLVNFVRSCHQKGQAVPADISSALLEDDVYLKPVLENDTFLYTLDEIIPEVDEAAAAAAGEAELKDGEPSKAADVSIDGLLTRNKALEGELEAMRSQFANYRQAVEETLERRWGVDDVDEKKSVNQSAPKKTNHDYYFESYAAHGEYPLREGEETCLADKDTIRKTSC